MPQHMHTITAIAAGDNWRVLGWFPTKLEAELALQGPQANDIFQNGLYTHAVIEAVAPGISETENRDVWWYRADYRGGGEYHVTPLTKPPVEYGTTSWVSMG